VRTLHLKGHGTFFPGGTAASKVIAERYEMWREMDPNRTVAHGADGKVRIEADRGGAPMIRVAFDGTTTYTADGPMDPAKAAAYWANNFGFGIIRQALKPGFTLTRLPDDWIDGHAVYVVRIVDPSGQETVFSFDQAKAFVRRVGFATPRGWHERTYDRYFSQSKPRWLQAGRIRLTYNGVVQNILIWEQVKVNPVLAAEVFVIQPSQSAGASAANR
jgi:hypothetical protein